MPSLRIARVFGHLCVLLSLSLPRPLLAQTPPGTKPMNPEKFNALLELLRYAVRSRLAEITNFKTPDAQVTWRVTSQHITKDVLIAGYSPSPNLVFHVQAIQCHDLGKDLIDATILGPTETAADFYDANVQFVFYPPDDYLPCMAPDMKITRQQGNVRHEPETSWTKASIYSSHDRAIRQVYNWFLFLAGQRDDPKRTADFFVTILDKEKAELLRLESTGDHSETAGELNFFETLFPSSTFDGNVPLDQQGRARVRDFLTTRIRIRTKLGVFLPGASERIQRDEALLQKFR